MQFLAMRAAAALVVSLALGSCQAGDSQKSSELSTRQSEELELLLKAPQIESEQIGEDGSYSNLIRALKIVTGRKEAKGDLNALIQSKSPVAVGYALIGMYFIDRPSYLETKKRINLNQKVHVLFGDLEGTLTLSEILTALEQNRVKFGLKLRKDF